MVDVFKMTFVLLLMSSLLMFCHASCNKCKNETSKVSPSNSMFSAYRMDVVDLSGDQMVVGIRGCVGQNYFSQSSDKCTYYSVDIYKRVNKSWSPEFEIFGLQNIQAVAINNRHMAFISKINGWMSVSIFRNVNHTWVNQTISNSNLSYSGSYYTMAINNDNLVIGSGSKHRVFVFMNKNDSWILQPDILAPYNDTTFSKRSTTAVDMDGYYIAVSGASETTGSMGPAVVIIFRNDNNKWVEESKFFPPYSGYYSSIKPLTIDGDRVAIGNYAGGIVYVYKRVNGIWINETQLVPSDRVNFNYFGKSVSLRGNYLVVGDIYNRATAHESGAVYVYRYIGLQWVEVVKLVTSDLSKRQNFGSPAVVDGNYIAVVKGLGSHYYYATTNTSIYTYYINDILNITLSPSDNTQNGKMSLPSNTTQNGNMSMISNNSTKNYTNSPLSNITKNGNMSMISNNSNMNYTNSPLGNNTQNGKMSMILHCNYLNMTAYWPTTSFTGKNISVVMIDSGCKDMKSNESMLWITVSYDSCATITEEDEVNILISNTAIMTVLNSPNNIISRGEENYQFNMLCRFPRELKLSLFNGYNFSDSSGPWHIINTSANAEYHASINIYDSSLFLRKSTYPVKVTLNEPMYVGIEKNPNPNVKMVVTKCFATTSPSINGDSYVFFVDKCPLDNTFKIVEFGDNRFNFMINAFRFIKIKKVIFLHCAVLICKKNSTLAQCKQGCSSRKRRDINYALALYQTDMQYITTGQILYQDSKSCTDVAKQCPANSICFDMYPPVCRCNEGFVLSKRNNICIKERIINFKKLHIGIKWNNAYSNRHSKGFIRFAVTMEIKLYRLFVEVLGLRDIVGIKVLSARPGSVLLDFSLIHSATSTKENVSGVLLKKMQENNNNNNSSSSKGFAELNILMDNLPTLEQEVSSVSINNLAISLGICIPIAVITLVAGSMYVYKHIYRKDVSVVSK